MTRVRRKMCFCVLCGKENHVRYKKCKHCKKKLHQKNHLLKDYMLDNIKDKFKDKVTDKIISIIKAYFLSHIYGTMLIATVFITSATVVFNKVTNTVEINKIQTRPTLLSSELSICDNSIEPNLFCEDSLGFDENNMCIMKKTVNATSYKECSDGYHLSNSKCISDKIYNKSTEEKCVKPTTLPSFMDSWDQFIKMVEDVDQNTGELLCGIQHCTDSTCNAGTVSEIPTTTVTSCSEGSIINGECHKTKSPTTKYSCERGTLDGKKCVIEYTEEPEITCKDGYEYNASCSACVEVE